MICIRPVTDKDLPEIFAMAQMDQMGLTGFPANLTLLEKKIIRSKSSFTRQPQGEQTEALYFFVMEASEEGTAEPAGKVGSVAQAGALGDSGKLGEAGKLGESGQGGRVGPVIGCCAIEARLGVSVPFYSFKVDLVEQTCPSLHKNINHKVLHMVNDYHGASEICSLFLHPAYRSQHRGIALSLSRFLFMAQFPQLFSEVVMAEIRGVSDEQGACPFWDAIGRYFLDMTFTEADRLTNLDKQYIADLMPRYPIYLELLPPAAQAVIARPHDRARPAKLLLERQGFEHKGYIDIFDGGPAMEARCQNIAAIRQSRLVQVQNIVATVPKNGSVDLMSNNAIDFRATMGTIEKINDHAVILTQQQAHCLQVQRYDTIRIVSLTG